MEGARLWAFYPTGTLLPSGVRQHWIPVQCDADGKVQVYDSTTYELVSSIGKPLPALYEDWCDLAIDPGIWTHQNPATGTPWTPQVVILAPNPVMNVVEPNANETARLYSNRLWNVPATALTTQYILKRLMVEIEIAIGNVANVDNTLFFMGLTQTQVSTRATNNLIGWALLADALQSLTDVGGVEEANTGFGETINLVNKLRLDVITGATVTVEYRLNETLVATHNTSIPLVPSYINFFIDTEAGGAAGFYLGGVRIWYEDFIRT